MTRTGGQHDDWLDDPPLTSRISQFVLETDINADARRSVATVALADTVAVAVAGSRTEASRTLRSSLGSGESGDFTVIGSSEGTTLALACLFNGTAAHALDFDDTLTGLTIHPSCHLVPALVALAEAHSSTGRELLDCLLVGIEVEARLAETMRPWHYARGWHSTGTIGTVAVAAASARLLGLTAQQARNALAIACSSAAGIQANFGSMTKPLHAGRAARSGVEAALLAAHGFDSSEAVFEHPRGFLRAMGAESAPADIADTWQHDRLRELTSMERLSFKLYPCCGEAGAAVHAAIDLRREFAVSEIERVEIGLSSFAFEVLRFPRPTTADQARFSAEYCVSTALVDGAMTLESFDSSSLARPDVEDLMRRCEARTVDTLAHEQSARIVVHARRGTFEREVDVPPGHFSLGLSEDQLTNKFVSCTHTSMSESRALELLAACRSLDSAADVRELARLVRVP